MTLSPLLAALVPALLGWSLLNALLGWALLLLSIFLILLILVQRGRGGGLAGALGGPGGQSAFGTKAGDLFTRITSFVALGWIALCRFHHVANRLPCSECHYTRDHDFRFAGGPGTCERRYDRFWQSRRRGRGSEGS